MKWQKGRESTNVIEGGSEGTYIGGGAPLRIGGMRLGIGGLLFIVIASLVLGFDPIQVLTLISGGAGDDYVQTTGSNAPSVPSDDPQVRFVRSILGSTEDVWSTYFRERGETYEPAKLQIFNGYTRSGCGLASQAAGPFYCTADQRVYLDLHFFKELETKFHAKGEFAAAYVIAHEIGHHVQDLLGVTQMVSSRAARGEPMEGATGLSVRLELQADCFAGVWGNRSEQQLNWLQPGDVESALNAAQQIGDDLLATRANGYAVPDSFTHGTSAQRVRWFKQGLSSGDIGQCDTFRAASL